MNAGSASPWERLRNEVVAAGICTHCGTCAGLADGALVMRESAQGPLPAAVAGPVDLPPLAYDACPGKGIDYPHAYRRLFGALPDNWLLGCYRQLYVGHAVDEQIRRAGASGGVITRTLLYLLESGAIDGAIVLIQGRPRPWQAAPVIARTRDEILAAAQSVYVPAPVNTILPAMAAFRGRLAYVGLPDQVAALRVLQAAGHPGAAKVDYVLGPYVGTAMYLGAIESFLRSHGIKSLEAVASLRYREGEWPGYLQITTHDGRTLRAEKFYYNYLIPFYITQSTLQAVDFTNELTDISVGDAWHPAYEARGEGYSVVMARSEKGVGLLQTMVAEGVLALEETTAAEAMAMHGHMLDFKKRGGFLRNRWRRARGKRAPVYGYQPAQIPVSRRLVEAVIITLFALGRTRLARAVVERIPLAVIGPLFNYLRQSWKRASKPAKRRGLVEIDFAVTTNAGPDVLRTRPGQAKPSRTLLQRIKQEIDYWTHAAWSFADIEAHFDDLAADYDAINDSADSYFRRFTDTMRLANLPDDAYVLDICARTGNGIAYFYEQGKVGRAVCADVSSAMGELCRQRLQAAGLRDFRWQKICSYQWPFATGEFDVVLSLESVEHFDRPDLFIGELGRVTSPGGTLVLSTPNPLWEPLHALAAVAGLHHSEGPHRFLPLSRLRLELSRAGFEVSHLETEILVPAGPVWLLHVGRLIEARTRDSLMPIFGLRRLIICRKLP